MCYSLQHSGVILISGDFKNGAKIVFGVSGKLFPRAQISWIQGGPLPFPGLHDGQLPEILKTSELDTMVHGGQESSKHIIYKTESSI